MDLRSFTIDYLCIKVFDPTKQELIATYASYKEAAKALGLKYRSVYDACTTKKRRFSPILNMEVAIRAAKKE